jgi:hypothetical protein
MTGASRREQKPSERRSTRLVMLKTSNDGQLFRFYAAFLVMPTWGLAMRVLPALRRLGVCSWSA